MSEDELTALVSRDSMIGTGLARKIGTGLARKPEAPA
jgi:hypothetical protein